MVALWPQFKHFHTVRHVSVSVPRYKNTVCLNSTNTEEIMSFKITIVFFRKLNFPSIHLVFMN